MNKLDGVLAPAYTWADWQSDDFATTDASNLPVTLTGLTIEAELMDRFNNRLLLLSTATGEITITSNQFSWFVPQSRMSALPSGNHIVTIRITDPADGTIEHVSQRAVEVRKGAFA